MTRMIKSFICAAFSLALSATSALAFDTPYLTFRSASEFTLKTGSYGKGWDGTMEYSTDTVNWTVWDGASSTTLTAAQSGGEYFLYLRGTDNTTITAGDSRRNWTFPTGSDIYCEGDIETLRQYDTGKTPKAMAGGCYASLFEGCTKLKSAPTLSATTLTQNCYYNMFKGCTALVTAPALPATTLAQYCYYQMFYGCTSLTAPPSALPATTLPRYCYQSMFSGCTSLATAPTISATTLASDSCCMYMFKSCSSLVTAPELHVAVLTMSCYANMFEGCTALTTVPALTATTLYNQCYKEMFKGCTSLVTAPTISATTLASSCCLSMFEGCTKLEIVPDFPELTLADSCYKYMFARCSALETPPALPATTLANSCYYGMFINCSSLKTMPKLEAMTVPSYAYQEMFRYCSALQVSTELTPGKKTWKLPAGLSGASNWNLNMLANTGGSFKSDPVAGTTYYIVSMDSTELSLSQNEFAAWTGDDVNINLASTIVGGSMTYVFPGPYNASPYSLPAGLTLTSGGALTGSISTAGTYDFIVKVQDTTSPTPLTMDAEYRIVVTDPAPITAPGANLGKVRVGKAKNFTLSDTVAGGVAPYTFTLASGVVGNALPAGYEIVDGVLVGTATEENTYTFTLTVKDKLNVSRNFEYTLVSYIPVGLKDDDPDEPETGDSVVYVNTDGSFTRTCNKITSSSAVVTWEDSWYYVTNNVTLQKGAIVNGKVSLILCDGATLTIDNGYVSPHMAGIRVVNDGTTTNTLTIYAQEGGTGKLKSKGGSGCAGIGGDEKGDYNTGEGLCNCGKVIIYGGVIEAKGGGSYGAGIGGGTYGNGGTVKIYGGDVSVTSGTYASGIGGGGDNSHPGMGGDVEVYGGTVTAIAQLPYYAGVGSYAGNAANQGSLKVGPYVTVKAGTSNPPTTVLEHGVDGAIDLGTGANRQYFKFEATGPASLAQIAESATLQAYTDAAVNWNLASTITGGTTPYTFAIKEWTGKPAGISLSSAGVLTGTFTAAGVHTFTVTVTDSGTGDYARSDDFEYAITVTVGPKSITYKDGETTLTELSPSEYTPGTAVNLAAGPEKTGYTFDGWFNNSGLTGDAVTAVSVEETTPLTFWAKYTPIVYSVTYKDGDTAITDQGLAPTSYTIESETLNLPATATKSGKGFYGWYTNSTCTGSEVTTIPHGSTGNKTFWAKWGPAKSNESYIDGSGNPANVECMVLDTDTTTLSAGWYVAKGTLEFNSAAFSVSGDVKLILADGATLTVTGAQYKAGVNVPVGSSLTIYCQSAGTGALAATGGTYGAGIGGNKEENCGAITVYGGMITATGGWDAAGIGGGLGGDGGTVTIYDGTVVAQANTAVNHYASGIGGGYNGAGGTVAVYGGTVVASANGSNYAGIGGYNSKSQGSLTVGEDIVVRAGSSTPLTDGNVIRGKGDAMTVSLTTLYRYYAFEVYTAPPIERTGDSTLEVYTNQAINWDIAAGITGGMEPLGFALSSQPAGVSLANGVLTGSVAAAGTYNFTVTVTDSSSPAQVESFAYTLEVARSVGFIDDDPDEPANGDVVQCRTADGVLRDRTCNQVVNSTTAVTWSNSWYYVTGNVTLNKEVAVRGKVSLVLGDNATLTINGTSLRAGINVTGDDSLVIYGQDNGTGALVATAGNCGAGIGGNSNQSCGKIAIYGGSVTANGADDGSGIGGGRNGHGGTVIINGGTVAATGNSYAAGIGGGSSGNGGAVTINGGTVTATGGANGAGIGGGGSATNGGNGGTVTVNGGTVTATGGTYGAGIGGGNAGAGGTVTINGGTVRAMTSTASTSSYIPTGIGKGYGNGLSTGTLTVVPGTTVKTGFSSDSPLTTQTPVNNVVTIGTGTSYRYFEIDGPRPLSLMDGTLAPALTGGQSSWTLSDTIDGGISPYTFAEKVANSLPSGLSLINGVLSGRPSAAGNYAFTLVVTDSASGSIDAEYTLVVSDPPAMSVSPTDLGSATTNATISSIDLSSRVSGGIPSYRFALKSGSSLPAGLSLSSAGVLSGRPTQPNNYSFVITVTDSALPANSCDATLTLAVKAIYSITYYDGETKLSPSSEHTRYVEGEFKTLSYAPVKSDYRFIGWRDGQGNMVTRIEDTDTGNKTFYAVWEACVTTKSVTFIGADGNEQTETCTIISEGASATLASGWYVASGSVSFSSGLTINGTTANPVHLVLEDGCTLTVAQGTYDNAGISVATGKSLAIYGQSGNTGTLNVTGGSRAAGIGGGRGAACGTVTINGGTVNATGGSQGGAGIGGGYDASGNGGDGGTVTINGGNVVAVGNNGAGIGGAQGGTSYTSGNGGTVTINGGNVTATAGGTGAGIGGAGNGGGTARAGSGGTVTINGGTVIATAANRGAGIGGGMYGSGGNVTITGGRVIATGGEMVFGQTKYVGAGIGAGNGGVSQGTLTVANVIVKAGDSEYPETELTPNEGLVALSGEQYYVVADESAGVISPIVYMSGSERLRGLSPANYDEGQGVDITTAVPAKTGYTFAGWYDNADLEGEPVTAVSAEATGAQTFYADWTLTNYTITYIDQDGTTPIAGLSPTSYTIETETFTLPAPAAPAGKMFDGWYTTSDFSTPDVSAIIKGTAGNKRYYAKWLSVETTSVTFVGADGTEQTEQCRPLAVGISELRNGGWYVVNSTLDYRTNGGLAVHGVANLVLEDGASLAVTGSTQQAGIAVTPGNTLNIYAQSAGTGRLEAYGGMNSAGIGGGANSDNGTVNIYGGVVSANGRGGAGIGGGSNSDGGTVNIYGGTVTANGVSTGAGIGGGSNGGNGGNVTINGGTVTANGGFQAAGIGGGYKGINQAGSNGGTVRINGGTVVAIGGSDGAGIGAGLNGGEQGELFVGDGMTAFAGASENPSAAPARDPVTGEVVLSGERYYTVAPTSYDTSFSITYINGAQTLTGLLPGTYSSGAGTNLPTAVEMARNGVTFGGWYETPDFTGEAVTAIGPGSTGEKTFYAKWTASYIAMDGTTGVHDCTEVTSSTTSLTDGWYVVTGVVELDSTLPVTGSANLILADGASLSVTAEFLSSRSGIEIASGKTLTVYGQAGGTGVLGAKGATELSGIDGTLAISARMVAKGGARATSTLYPMARDASTGIVTLLVYGDPMPYVTVRSVVSSIVYMDGETPIAGLFPTNYYEGTVTALPTEAEVTKEGYTFDGWYTTYDFSLLPVTNIDANATGTQTFYAKFTPNFTIVDGVLTGINPKLSGTITIPDTVRKIGGGTGANFLLWDFMRARPYDVTGLVIPSSVTNISDFAFSRSENLTTVTIPEGVRYIGTQAFSYCTNLTELTLPKGIEVGDAAFFMCTSLESVNISGEVVRRSTKRLLSAGRLLAAVPSNSEATTVGDYAFLGCNSLESLKIGSKVEDIGGGAFSGCTSLNTIDIEEGNDNFMAVDGLFLTKDGTTLIFAFGNKTEITVTNSVVTIEAGAFAGYSTLTNVVLQSGVVTIGEAAFSNATQFASITIPATVTTIGAKAFYGTALATVYVSKGDTSHIRGLVEGTGYSSPVTYIELGDEPVVTGNWPETPSSVEGQTASAAFGIAGELATAKADDLATWAKAKGVDYANREEIIPDAFLLNCANNAAAVATATEEAEEAIEITAITIVNGVPQLTYPATYGNGQVVIQGSANIGASASWHDGKQPGDRFFKTVLRLK